MRAALLLLACCATAGPTAAQKLEAACRQSMESDPRCLELLTGGDEYESRAEVMAAEQRREAEAFESRLQRLRREEEARQRTRASTVSADLDPEAMEAIAEAAAEEDPDSEEAVDLSPERPTPIQTAELPRATEAPTPAEYLMAAVCLLAKDRIQLREVFARARIADLAVRILDVEALEADIEGEMKHRSLPAVACREPPPLVALLRSLVGKPAVDSTTAAAYEKGLVRLRKELEVRAGLPPKK